MSQSGTLTAKGSRSCPEARAAGTVPAPVSNCIFREHFLLLASLINKMRKIWKWFVGGAAAGFALLQLTNPSRTNPTMVAGRDLISSQQPPPEIAALLHAACYDCHSDETRWPWYSRIAPMSWLIANDVRGGREQVNFSDWPTDLPGRAAKRLERMSEEIDYKEMPPAKYTLMHPEARLTAAQRQALIDWADQSAAKLKAMVKDP